MSTWSFYYRVKRYYNNNYYYESGLGICSGYCDAMAKIEDMYGEDLSAIEHLEIVEMTNLVVLPDSVCSNYANERYSDTELAELVPSPANPIAKKKED